MDAPSPHRRNGIHRRPSSSTFRRGRPSGAMPGAESRTRPATQSTRRSSRVIASMRRRSTSRSLAWTRLIPGALHVGRRRFRGGGSPCSCKLRPRGGSAGVRRIIYLGGLADQAGSLSSHLQSRAETGSVLRASGIPVIKFRASIVVGAGSLSFQMIEALVERLPVMVCPRWVATLTQPMAVDDVVAYLAAALELPDTGSEVFEIGGPDVVSYSDIMREDPQSAGCAAGYCRCRC